MPRVLPHWLWRYSMKMSISFDLKYVHRFIWSSRFLFQNEWSLFCFLCCSFRHCKVLVFLWRRTCRIEMNPITEVYFFWVIWIVCRWDSSKKRSFWPNWRRVDWCHRPWRLVNDHPGSKVVKLFHPRWKHRLDCLIMCWSFPHFCLIILSTFENSCTYFPPWYSVIK